MCKTKLKIIKGDRMNNRRLSQIGQCKQPGANSLSGGNDPTTPSHSTLTADQSEQRLTPC